MEEEGRAPKIKNRAPAPVQITAEQLLREAQENQERPRRQTARHRIEDYEQLEEYRARKRKEFEDSVRKLRGNVRIFANIDGCLDSVRDMGSEPGPDGSRTLRV